ncbi:IS982 family transposase [Phormidium sp. CLA17]|uniref:IS982 family transposase n=1 Tax=Leptolyngbya sp. Cla-17 TaxID=2803751 RepID=UPI001490D3A7|nr:IS982 family transposase [Leptolyngbya sp. Cla-17]MBM0740482.1 IS982 family transposase [Leptolyngbya sp. Cla-17]MBM0741756.1 IS982 family transposase [Leptolyngbya sp. Cla-17]MBM0744033.1 IS982 family transposase [Leptolyngbya sp. Cla-17]
MFTIEEFITAVFCCVDDLLKEITQGQAIREKGFAPGLADSEVLTMEIVAEYQGIDADQAIWHYFRRHWLGLFPRLSSRSAFVRQAANLWQYKELLQQRFAIQLGAFADAVHLIDGIPIPLCGFSRAPRCRSFKGEAAYGYCAAKKQTYYGFHGHLLLSSTGVITGFSLTPANGSEREALWDIVSTVRGLLIGDKGYLSGQLEHQLQAVGIQLETALRSNMPDERDPAWVKLLMRVRRLIETVIGQLVERFSIEKVRARDLWHLTSRLNRKLLAHTVCRWLNRHSPNPLQFEQLVSD